MYLFQQQTLSVEMKTMLKANILIKHTAAYNQVEIPQLTNWNVLLHLSHGHYYHCIWDQRPF
jgi:hypothetical protein